MRAPRRVRPPRPLRPRRPRRSPRRPRTAAETAARGGPPRPERRDSTRKDLSRRGPGLDGRHPRQTAAVSAAVRSGEPFAWALTEPGHGADLANGEVTAARRTGGFLLDGTKWPINNATRADHLVVLARTGDPGTARGHSLFLVDKRRLARGTWRALPKAATHGVRGIDISGIEFSAAELSEAALLGPEGSGLETVLRSLQLTRTMCTALSLGAGEQALRLTAGFTATRLIQRTPLADRPRTRSIVTRCAALLAATEAAASLGARSIHSLTDELSVTSAVVKALAPTLIDAVVADLAELLGLRSFLTGEYAHGAFQKLWRDHHVVAIFDGSTPVNRAALIPQYGRLARGFARADVDTDGLAEAAASGTRPRRLDHRALTLTSRRGCSVVQSLPILAEALADRGAPDGLAEHAAALAATAADIALLMGRPGPRPGRRWLRMNWPVPTSSATPVPPACTCGRRAARRGPQDRSGTTDCGRAPPACAAGPDRHSAADSRAGAGTRRRHDRLSAVRRDR